MNSKNIKTIMRNKKVKVWELFYNRANNKRYQITAIDRGNRIYLKEYDAKENKELLMYPYKSFVENFIPDRVNDNDIVAGYSMGKLRYVNIVEVKNYDTCFRFKKPDGSRIALSVHCNSSGVLSQLGKRDDGVEYRLVWGKERELFERRTKYNRVLSNLNKLKEQVLKNSGNDIIQDKYKLNKIDKELKMLLKIFKEVNNG